MARLAFGSVTSVLIVEDDQRIREALTTGLTAAGYNVRAEGTGAAALTAAVEWKPDAVILDLGLPDIDGADVLKMLRSMSQVPVIVATARDDELEIVRLLDRGADDYVVKPYSSEQIEARIRAVMRRSTASGGGVDEIRIGTLTVEPRRRVAMLDGNRLDLTRMEFDLLCYLATRSPEVVTRRELMAEVWRQPYGGGDKTVDVHLSWLRRKLGETATESRYLQTVRGVGVRLQAPGLPGH